MFFQFYYLQKIFSIITLNMLTCQKNKNPDDSIKLPTPKRIEMPKPNFNQSDSGDNLAEMNNFYPPISCTPPDKGFMENLMRRMERT